MRPRAREIAIAMLRDLLAEERRQRRLLEGQVADMREALRQAREREALRLMSDQASRLFESSRTQPITAA